MGLGSKIRTLQWFAQRPPLWPQAAHLVMRKLQPNLDTSAHRQRATAWCRAHASSTAELLDRVGASHQGEVRALAGDAEWSAAEARAASCPTQMGGEGHLDLLYACAESTGAMRVVETGVAYGWSTYALLLSLANRPGSRLISTDMPYVQQSLDAWVGCVVPERLRPHWTLLRQADRQALPKALSKLGTLDLCHYDSDKSYQGRLWAYPLLWDALRPGGLLVSDDVQDNEGFRHFVERLGEVRWGVTEAYGKYVGLIQKPSP